MMVATSMKRTHNGIGTALVPSRPSARAIPISAVWFALGGAQNRLDQRFISFSPFFANVLHHGEASHLRFVSRLKAREAHEVGFLHFLLRPLLRPFASSSS